MKTRIILALLLCMAAPGRSQTSAAADANWPQFRGPNASGVSANPNLPDKWSAVDNVAWKTDLPGRSWSSPIVWGDRVFLTAVVNAGQSEPPKKGLYMGGERLLPPKSEHLWKVLCLDLTTGKLQWEKTVHQGVPQTPIHLKNSYGAETPVTDGRHVYAVFGNLGVFAFTLEGAEVWSSALSRAKRPSGGARPRHRCCTTADYSLSTTTRSSLNCSPSMPSPARNSGASIATRRAPGLRPSFGKTANAQNSSRPAAAPSAAMTSTASCCGRLAACRTSPSPPRRPATACSSSAPGMSETSSVRSTRSAPAPSGDITLQPDQTSNEFIAWSNPTAGPYNPSPLYYQGRLYVLYDRGLVSCFDAKTGRVLVRTPTLAKGSGLYFVPMGGQWKGLLPQRRRCLLRSPRRRQVRTPRHQQTGRRRHVYGHPRDVRRPPSHPLRPAALLHPNNKTDGVNGSL